MDPRQNNTTILSIETIELYQRVGNNSNLLFSGPLKIIYNLSNNSFAISTKNYNCTLTKDVFIHAIPPREGESYPSYIFPAHDKTNIIKIIKIASPETLSSFETILNNNCNLVHQDMPEEHSAKNIAVEESLENDFIEDEASSNVITKGGELIRKGLIKSAELISRGIMSFGNYIQNKFKKETEEKKVNETTVEKLNKANIMTSAVYGFARTIGKWIICIGAMLGNKVEEKFDQTNLGAKIKNQNGYESVKEAGKSSLYASACIYDGIVESFSIVGRGVSDTTSKVVGFRYGKQMGDATKQGFSVFGNLTKIVGIFKEEALSIINGVKKQR